MDKNNANIQLLFTKWTDKSYDLLWNEFKNFVGLPEHHMQGMQKDFDQFCWDWFCNNSDISFGVEDTDWDIVVEGCDNLKTVEEINKEMEGTIVAFDGDEKFYFYNQQ